MMPGPRRESRAGRGFAVRDARRTDLPTLLEIYNDAVLTSPATFDLEPLTLAQRKKWFSDHGRLHPLVVAESDERVVGYASLSPFRDKPGYSKSVEDSVYVHRDFQGKGVGTLLTKEILARAARLGYHTVVAGIVPPNEASVRLHEGLGFAYVGNFREVGFKFSRWQDVAFYQLFLPVRR
ncbi:MAG: GNAT family N-acetyltransferase, partial [Nitrososphaerales archaeon]